MIFRALGRFKRTTHAGISAAWGPVCARDSIAIDKSRNEDSVMLNLDMLAVHKFWNLKIPSLGQRSRSVEGWSTSKHDASAKDTVEGGSPCCSTRAATGTLKAVDFIHEMIDKHVPIRL